RALSVLHSDVVFFPGYERRLVPSILVGTPIRGIAGMADYERVTLLHRVRRLAADAGGGSDSQLLARFAAHHDEAAFELLLRRHPGLVFGVCRRVLRDVHDAEDAFQATFLALARRAGRIERREAVAGWLYQVAYRAALAARAKRARTASRERPLPAADA